MITRLKFGILEQERRYQPLVEIVLVLMLFSPDDTIIDAGEESGKVHFFTV